jgi:hypothetical protein
MTDSTSWVQEPIYLDVFGAYTGLKTKGRFTMQTPPSGLGKIRRPRIPNGLAVRYKGASFTFAGG